MKTKSIPVFEENQKIFIKESDGSLVDTVKLISQTKEKVTVESTDQYPGKESKFVFTGDGWKLLFLDLLDKKCINKRAPTYKLTLN